MSTILRAWNRSGFVITVLLILFLATVTTGLATASGLVDAGAQPNPTALGWRDIANALFGILLAVLSANVMAMKKDIERRVDISIYKDSIRRIDHNEIEIGTLFSKIHDEEVSRLKAHMDVMAVQNQNQSAILSTLASIAARTANINGHQGFQAGLGGGK